MRLPRTNAVESGTHGRELLAEALDGRRAHAEIPVVVLNDESSLELSAHVDWQSLLPWQTITGPVVWERLPAGR